MSSTAPFAKPICLATAMGENDDRFALFFAGKNSPNDRRFRRKKDSIIAIISD